MKIRHFIISNPTILSERLAQRSQTIGRIIYSAQKYYGRFENMNSPKIIHNLSVNLEDIAHTDWIVLSDGRFVTKINQELIKNLINENGSDMIMLNADNGLESYREDIRLQFDNEVAGYRRFFINSLLPHYLPNDWPNYIIIKSPAFKSIIENDSIPERFCIFLKRCVFSSVKMKTYKTGGSILNLNSSQNIIMMVNDYINSNHIHSLTQTIGPNVRIYGKIVSHENSRIENGATIVGPSIIGEDVTIPSSATIYNSIICPGTKIADNSFIRSRITGFSEDSDASEADTPVYSTTLFSTDNYKQWPVFSYAVLGKRICDFLIALIFLPCFLLIFIFMALIIKITSPGPIFFKHKRQGLKGKSFSCLKFRTMIVNADDIQEKLKFINQVDGPQFKIDDDPRVTMIGRFLRDTHIDELPQFINILLGQMSLIGPRPSPAKENSFCSYWRDARLSVRPGITGLWQIYRTRESGQDFQEWIYYDTQYVKNLSLKLDIKIFFLTAIRLMFNFFKHL